MKVEIIPSVAVGSVLAPPSKSFSHRALICGALSKKSVIKRIAFGFRSFIRFKTRILICKGLLTINKKMVNA